LTRELIHDGFDVPIRPHAGIVHAIAMIAPEILHISTVSNSW
jgi:hypothetical protein